MKSSPHKAGSVAAAFAAALAAAPVAAQAAAPEEPAAAAAAPLQPSAAVMEHVQDMRWWPFPWPFPPFGEVWVEYGPFVEIQPH